VLDDDGKGIGASTFVVAGYLSAAESEFEDDAGHPAELWRVQYTDGPLQGDEADLEEHEIKESQPEGGHKRKAATRKRKRRR